MIKDKFGQQVYNKDDVINLLMQEGNAGFLERMVVDTSVDINIETGAEILKDIPRFVSHQLIPELTVEEFDRRAQANWKMPQAYKDLDIAEYVLNLCKTDAELQRVGEELLLYQERDLFDLLKYLKYLVDTMTENRLIWGVGRGSSVASYVLYLLGVHKIDSMYYDLDPREFLR